MPRVRRCTGGVRKRIRLRNSYGVRIEPHLTTGGLIALVPLDLAWTPADVAWRLAVLGAGAGLFGAPNLTAAMSRAPRQLLGTTGATTSLARQLGITFGAAVATTVWALGGYTPAGMRAAIAVAVGFAALALLLTARDRVPTGTHMTVGTPAHAPRPPDDRAPVSS